VSSDGAAALARLAKRLEHVQAAACGQHGPLPPEHTLPRYVQEIIALRGSRDMLSALDSPEAIVKLEIAVEQAQCWRQQLQGRGRQSLQAALHLPAAEMVCAVAGIQLCRLLRFRPRGPAEAALCELLWLLAGRESDAVRWQVVAPRVRCNKHRRDVANACSAIDVTIQQVLEPHLTVVRKRPDKPLSDKAA
jgi:hypothetical protein